MHLWNDYEGTMLAGQWQLGRLLRTEGRSALFSTTPVGASGGLPSVLRLTEALNDQAVLQARYRAIQAAGDRYLVSIQGYGDAVLDGTPLSYAVLEPTQESLADILAARRLSPEEAMEVATSVAGGLRGLHAQGLVHGLVEAESVLAAGDRIKLRSDCARPAPAPEDAALEGAITPQTDAFGLAGVIYQSLTLNRLHDAADALALPEPFATIVRHTARGAWGVPEIEAELVRYHRAHAPVVPEATPVTSVAVPETVSYGVPQPSTLVHDSIASTPRVLETEDSVWKHPDALPSEGRRMLYAGLAGAAVLLLLVFLLFHRSGKQTATPAATKPAVIAAPVSPSTLAPAPGQQTETAPSRQTGSAEAASAASAALAGQKVWRVIAYTYNRRGEADKKAASINQHFPGFDAQVWSRTGERPFLVTLGSGMTQQQAFALRARARAAGLARDLYAQNYTH